MKVIGTKIHVIDECTSTNRLLSQYLKKGFISEGFVLRANYQTDGRGQMNNHWESVRNMNLTFSFVIYPNEIELESHFILSKFVALGVCDFLKRYFSNVYIKWPNDIYIGEKKIAGILIENVLLSQTIKSSLMGIGLNVNQDVFLSDAPNPISMNMLSEQKYNLEESLILLCKSIDRRYDQLKKRQFELIEKDYLNSLLGKNKWRMYRTPENGLWEGRIKNVQNDGKICIEDRGQNNLYFYFKEVEFITNK